MQAYVCMLAPLDKPNFAFFRFQSVKRSLSLSHSVAKIKLWFAIMPIGCQ